jgi:hypothetical protein
VEPPGWRLPQDISVIGVVQAELLYIPRVRVLGWAVIVPWLCTEDVVLSKPDIKTIPKVESPSTTRIDIILSAAFADIQIRFFIIIKRIMEITYIFKIYVSSFRRNGLFL